MNEFLREISSFNFANAVSGLKPMFWCVYTLVLMAYSWAFAKKPLAGVAIVLTTFLMYANDWFRGFIIFDPHSALIFTKFTFWFFFAAVLALDSLLYTKKPLRSLFMFLVSLFFYHKTSGLFFLLLLLTIHMDYIIALVLHHSKNELLRKVLAVFSITVNLGILCYFKYAYFFTESYNSLFNDNLKVINHLAVFGNSFTGQDWFRIDKIILPVGISFYTFQTISYIVEVYKRKLEPVTNLLNYGFYLSFFPQVLSGPITRASTFIPQIYKPYSLTREQFGLGVFWVLNGLTKKLLVGDYIAVNFIDRIYANPSMYTGLENILAVLAYSLQVYCDFSGYTDMATGVALLMGFHLTQNFNSPYKAQDVGDFWRRWHISLSTWLRDYLYIPLGGNRSATKGTFFWLILIGLLIAMLTNTYFKTDFEKVATLKAGDIAVFSAMTVLAMFAPLALLIYLVGRRLQKLRNAVTTEINMMITMLIGGLWHGASWMFIIWGGLNGLGLVVFKRWKKISPFANMDNVAVRIWGVCATYLFISFTRIFFRSPDLDTAKAVINQMVYNPALYLFFDIVVAYKWVFLVIVIGFIFHWIPETVKQQYRKTFANLPMPLMALVSCAIVFVLFQVATGELQRFIYFQF